MDQRIPASLQKGSEQKNSYIPFNILSFLQKKSHLLTQYFKNFQNFFLSSKKSEISKTLYTVHRGDEYQSFESSVTNTPFHLKHKKTHKESLPLIHETHHPLYVNFLSETFETKHEKEIQSHDNSKKSVSENTSLDMIAQKIKHASNHHPHIHDYLNTKSGENTVFGESMPSKLLNISDKISLIKQSEHPILSEISLEKNTSLPSNSHDRLYIPPLITLLTSPTSSFFNALETHEHQLEKVLNDFSIKGILKHIYPGPVVTCYALELSPGVKSSRVVSLSDDIARSLSVHGIRIAPIPGQNLMGIEIPNTVPRTVLLKEVLETSLYQNFSGQLPLALGHTTQGNPAIIDLARMPHILMAGTTGSGKSVALNAMILSLIYARSPQECMFIMIDPKQLELSVYEGIPHLLAPVMTEPKQAIQAMKWLLKHMEQRYKIMARAGARSLINYNASIQNLESKHEINQGKTTLPAIVVVIDELADLMLTAGKEMEHAVQRLAQMGRAAGIHVIMATQRPSVDVVTGVIKANFPSRISFFLPTRTDSRTILGEQGAERLLGKGDMLYMASGEKTVRLHGAFVSDAEVISVINFLKKHHAFSSYDADFMTYVFNNSEEKPIMIEKKSQKESSLSLRHQDALTLIQQHGKASPSFLRKKLHISYEEAITILDDLEQEGALKKK
jgi:S-DNA-T family DNA segregation ATPase FtsK/SpoIIIE